MLAVFFVKDDLIDLSRSNGIVDKFCWIWNPLNDINIFFCWNHTIQFLIVTSWVELASNLFDVRSTTTNDGSNRIHVWIMATNSNFGPVASFTRYAHDFNSSIVNFRNFLLHQTFDHFWMATTYEYVHPTRIVFYFVDKNFDAIMRLEDFTRDLILFRQLSFDRP